MRGMNGLFSGMNGPLSFFLFFRPTHSEIKKKLTYVRKFFFFAKNYEDSLNGDNDNDNDDIYGWKEAKEEEEEEDEEEEEEEWQR